MSLRINQNVLATRTQGQLAQTATRLEKSVEKLSSGLRINRASDDAAGLAISEKLRRQIRGLSRAILNAQDGISMIQTAEGALGESHSILQRMRELAIQASNDTLTSNDRLEIQKEVNQLRDDLNRISRNTEFNTKKLLDGSQTALISASSASARGLVAGTGLNMGDFEVSIALVKGGVSQMQRSQTFLVRGGGGELARGNTQLQSVAQMYDANGVFILQSPQTLTINGNGNTTTVTVDGQMTLDKLAAAIQNAVVGANGLAIANSQTAMVNTAQTGVAGMGGYIELTSGIIGETGKISFSADQALIDAMGMSQTRAAVNNQVEISSRDSSGNVRTVLTESTRASGLLNGIDLAFDSQAAQRAGTKGLELGLTIDANESYRAVVNNTSVTFTINAGDWSLEGIARSINNQTVGLDGFKAQVVDGQIRLSYDPPFASIASTIQITSAALTTTLGIVAGTYSGFVQGQKDESKNVWGFSRFVSTVTYGISAGSVLSYSVSDGVSATSVVIINGTLSSASVNADLRRFATFQASVNQVLASAGVDVRVDQIGAALAFTALRVGSQHTNTGIVKSMVSVYASAGGTLLSQKFGLADGTSRGSGDTNFRVHVVDNSPQFQIGGDPGQSMQVNFQNMSAEGLGVQNLDMTSVSEAARSIGKINAAIDRVSAERSKLGAFQNRLEYAISNLRNTHTNLSSAESRIRDADISSEMIEFTRNQIVNQSGTAMLAQANLLPQGVLQLLK